jgi:hypothetical protein
MTGNVAFDAFDVGARPDDFYVVSCTFQLSCEVTHCRDDEHQLLAVKWQGVAFVDALDEDDGPAPWL